MGKIRWMCYSIVILQGIVGKEKYVFFKVHVFRNYKLIKPMSYKMHPLLPVL